MVDCDQEMLIKTTQGVHDLIKELCIPLEVESFMIDNYLNYHCREPFDLIMVNFEIPTEVIRFLAARQETTGSNCRYIFYNANRRYVKTNPTRRLLRIISRDFFDEEMSEALVLFMNLHDPKKYLYLSNYGRPFFQDIDDIVRFHYDQETKKGYMILTEGWIKCDDINDHSDFMKTQDPDLFGYLSNNDLVNLSHIKRIQDYRILMDDGTLLKVNAFRYNVIMKHLKNRESSLLR